MPRARVNLSKAYLDFVFVEIHADFNVIEDEMMTRVNHFNALGSRRAYFLIMASYLQQNRNQDVIAFRQMIANEIDANFLAVLLIEKDKVWKTSKSQLWLRQSKHI